MEAKSRIAVRSRTQMFSLPKLLLLAGFDIISLYSLFYKKKICYTCFEVELFCTIRTPRPRFRERELHPATARTKLRFPDLHSQSAKHTPACSRILCEIILKMIFRSFKEAEKTSSSCLQRLASLDLKSSKNKTRRDDIITALQQLVQKLQLDLCVELWKDYTDRFDFMNERQLQIAGRDKFERQVERAKFIFLQVEMSCGAMLQSRSPKFLRKRSQIEKAGWTLVTCKDTSSVITGLLDELILVEEEMLIHTEYVFNLQQKVCACQQLIDKNRAFSASDAEFIPRNDQENNSQSSKSASPTFSHRQGRSTASRSATMRPVVDLRQRNPTRSLSYRP